MKSFTKTEETTIDARSNCRVSLSTKNVTIIYFIPFN